MRLSTIYRNCGGFLQLKNDAVLGKKDHAPGSFRDRDLNRKEDRKNLLILEECIMLRAKETLAN